MEKILGYVESGKQVVLKKELVFHSTSCKVLDIFHEESS